MENFLTDREMRTVIRDRTKKEKFLIGVPQGSILAPVMFAVYVNDMPERIDIYINLFADDAKLLKRMQKREDCEALQQDFDKIFEWFYTWKI